MYDSFTNHSYNHTLHKRIFTVNLDIFGQLLSSTSSTWDIFAYSNIIVIIFLAYYLFSCV